MNCEVHSRANLLLLFDKRPPLALAIKVNEQRHKDPAHAISGHIVTCSTRTHAHIHPHWSFTAEWFYKLKWIFKYRVSTHWDQNYISHSVITEHAHKLEGEGAHFVMINFLCPPCFFLSTLSFFFFCLFISLVSTSLSSLTLIPASPTIQSSLLVGLLCVLAGHAESLHLNQNRLKFGWKTSMCSTHTHFLCFQHGFTKLASLLTSVRCHLLLSYFEGMLVMWGFFSCNCI